MDAESHVSADTVTVAVIDNTTGATLLSCTVNSTNKNSCSNTSGSCSAAPGDNIEVRPDTGAGRDTLVVWPKNTDELTDTRVGLATTLGDEALFGVSEPVERFSGPPKIR
jgi:hypothetical protein